MASTLEIFNYFVLNPWPQKLPICNSWTKRQFFPPLPPVLAVASLSLHLIDGLDAAQGDVLLAEQLVAFLLDGVPCVQLEGEAEGGDKEAAGVAWGHSTHPGKEEVQFYISRRLTRWNKWPPCQPGRSLARREEGRAGRQFWDEQLRMGEERGKYDWFGFHTWILAPSIASATVDSGAARSTKKVELAWGAGGGLDIGNKISEIEMTKITRSRWWRMGRLGG